MTSIRLIVRGANARAEVQGDLTSGMVGIPVTIEYDEAWDGLSKNLVCRGGLGYENFEGISRTILGVGNTARVAPEVMIAGKALYLGIEGYNADGTIVIPTVWAYCGAICEGAKTVGETSEDPTLPIWDQLQAQINRFPDTIRLEIEEALQNVEIGGGNGIQSAVLNEDYTLTLTFDDGTFYTTSSIRGATGETGPRGEQGIQGSKGDKGDPGATGSKGADGYTPIRGVDYWTTSDQEDIVQQVIEALGTPVFGRVDTDNNIILTGPLTDGTYTLKYEDGEGNVTEIGTLVQDADAPNYTNWIPLSTNADGSIYNGVGYKKSSRIKSTGEYADLTTGTEPAFTTGFIHIPKGSVVRLKNCYIDAGNWDSTSKYGNKTWGIFIAMHNTITDSGHVVNWDVFETDGYMSGTPDSNNCWHEFVYMDERPYVRFTLAGTAETAILTINEEII